MRSDSVKTGTAQAPHRSLFNALGFTEEERRRPMIGIVSSFNEIVPGHMNLDKITEAVKMGVAMAGGMPVVFPAIAVCDGIAMGHVGMKYSLVTRDLIADSTECMAMAHGFDGLVCIPNCDKNVPGLLMAAARVNIPTIFVSGGPMLAGHVHGQKRSLSSMFEAVGSVAAGTMTMDELAEFEEKVCPTCGSCSGMYTANSMNCLTEALALNLAAPLALAGSSTIGAACSVTSVFLYPEYVGRVDGENVSCIQGEVSYDHGLLTFHGDVTLTTVGVADLGTVPLVKALSEKNLRLVANGKVTGRTKGNGIEEAKEIAGGEYDLTYADLGAYLDTKPNGILGGDTGTTITAGTEITLKDFHTGIGGGDVRIDGTVNITGAMFEGATYGIANFTTMNPGSELEIHADRYIRKDCLLTYNGGHLLMIVAENGDGNNIVQGRLSIGNDVSRFWYRTDENGAYTEINVKENYENFTAAIGQNQDYLELTDVDPDQPESETYDLWVAGKQVTKTNQSNVLGDGTVSYDPDTHTLTLNDADLTLSGDAEEGIYCCIQSELAEELTITGTATLSDAVGIMTAGPLTLNNADLTITGNIDDDIGDDAIRAGRSDEDITIQNSTVTIAGTNAEGNFFQYGIRCGNLIVANSTLNVKANSSAIEADELKASGAGTVITAETDSTDEDDYALELEYLTRYDGLVLVEGEMNKSKKARIARPEQAPTYFKVYWVVHPGDEPVNGGMQIPGAIFGSEEEERLFEGWFLEDGTRLEDSPYYMGPGVDHVGNLDRDVTFYGHWRTAESGEGSPDGGDGFGTLLAVGAVVGVAGVVAYQVGTELILDQLLPAGVAVPHTRAELAMLLWNTAGRPAPATLPAFADVADPELAQAAQWAIEQGYLKARADGSFKPDKGIAKWRVIRGYRAVTEP